MTAKRASYWYRQACTLAQWWLDHAIDRCGGGFWGEISYRNQANLMADKCIILNARILWFFSKIAGLDNSPACAQAATRAYSFLQGYFYDRQKGGFYWSVDAGGELQDSRKHVYAEAFCIYALAAYYEFSRDEAALDLALETNILLHRHARDPVTGGFFESFDRNWQLSEDLRLSSKEANFPKTMNTHLHVIEALTGLLKALQSSTRDSSLVEVNLIEAIDLYCDKIVDRDLGFVKMFFTAQWLDMSTHYSFGHDIESAWLLQKAIKLLAKPSLTERVLPLISALSRRALNSGLGANGRMRDEVDQQTGRESPTAWWVQFEAMVGFAYAYNATGEQAYRAAVASIWNYTAREYRDDQFGEWHWFGKADVPFERSVYKTGAWKAPYHTGRAFLELDALDFPFQAQS